MKYETYCALLSVIHQHLRPGDRKKCMNQLTESHPTIDLLTLGSIYSQEILKKVSLSEVRGLCVLTSILCDQRHIPMSNTLQVKKTFHKHAKLAEQYYRRFEAMAGDPSTPAKDVIIFNIAKDIEFPPSMLAKMIVERHLWWKKVSKRDAIIRL